MIAVARKIMAQISRWDSTICAISIENWRCVDICVALEWLEVFRQVFLFANHLKRIINFYLFFIWTEIASHNEQESRKLGKILAVCVFTHTYALNLEQSYSKALNLASSIENYLISMPGNNSQGYTYITSGAPSSLPFPNPRRIGMDSDSGTPPRTP